MTFGYPTSLWTLGFQGQVRMHGTIRSKLGSLVSSHLGPRVHPPWDIPQHITPGPLCRAT